MATNGFTNLGSGLTTDGNDFTVVAPGSGSSWITATGSTTQSGLLYFEYIPSYLSGANTASMFGWTVSGVSLTNYMAASTKGVGVNNQNNPTVYYNGAQFDSLFGSWGENVGSPNFLGCAIDTTTGRMKVYKSDDGGWYGTGGSFNAAFASVTGVDVSALTSQGGVQPAISAQSTTFQGANLGNWPPLIPGGMPSGYSMPNTGVGTSYTAGINYFNPSETSSQGALQSGQNNLRFYATSGILNSYQISVGNLPIPLGKAYWENRVESGNLVAAYGQVGIRRSGFGLDNSNIDNGTNVGAQYTSAGVVSVNGSTLATIATFGKVGDIVMTAVDAGAAKKIWFGKNGTWDGVPGVSGGYSISGIIGAGSIYPAVGLNGADNT
jgi:hypothetical protein